MSRIFKSNYVKIGTPKAIKSNTPPVKRIEPDKAPEGAATINAEEQANNIIEDAKELYLKIIEEANLEAKRILEQTNEEKHAIQENAGETGYKEGFDAGYAEGLGKAQDIIYQAMELKSQLDERNAVLYREAETEIMELVLQIADKVIGQELTQNNEVIMSLIKQAIQKCAFKDKLTIRVSEEDYSFVNANKDKIIMLTEGINDLDINCDKALPKGGCVVETPAGEINAGINVQMKEVQKAFEYLIRNE